ncbi:MAG: HoxN/HupN/NixA family nickel/cobalt transporter [Deltaproteobacteria bacterium]|jgi:high-affinity nickel-transport protein|nr:HoxN/HupN/NixA family nickel/cobalt transporter [Deltaproteobacteria bacterium]
MRANRTKAAIAGLVAFNIVAWVLLFVVSRQYHFLFGLGALAYVFGLRHAVDADHIAAIDNTTRKLMNDGKKPLGVGFFFSLGHSTIVFVLAVGMAVATHLFRTFLHNVDAVASLIGTLASALFLYGIGILNLVVLKEIYGIFKEIRQTNLTPEKMIELEEALLKRGLMNRVLGRMYASIKASWQMYPVGFLFGLGFDTPSEMAVLGMAVLAAGKSVPILAIFVLPLIFSAGMIMVDTMDGIVMQSAYSWAFLNPVRKVYYNLSITTISVLIAMGVGTVEALQVLSTECSLKGAVWTFLNRMDFGTMGYGIIGILLVSWAVAVVVYRIKGYEQQYGRV